MSYRLDLGSSLSRSLAIDIPCYPRTSFSSQLGTRIHWQPGRLPPVSLGSLVPRNPVFMVPRHPDQWGPSGQGLIATLIPWSTGLPGTSIHRVTWSLANSLRCQPVFQTPGDQVTWASGRLVDLGKLVYWFLGASFPRRPGLLEPIFPGISSTMSYGETGDMMPLFPGSRLLQVPRSRESLHGLGSQATRWPWSRMCPRRLDPNASHEPRYPMRIETFITSAPLIP